MTIALRSVRVTSNRKGIARILRDRAAEYRRFAERIEALAQRERAPKAMQRYREMAERVRLMASNFERPGLHQRPEADRVEAIPANDP
jgi:hypothetical protein